MLGVSSRQYVKEKRREGGMEEGQHDDKGLLRCPEDPDRGAGDFGLATAPTAGLLTIYLRQFTSALLIYLGLPLFTWDYLFWQGKVNCREVNKVTSFYLVFTAYNLISTTSLIAIGSDPSALWLVLKALFAIHAARGRLIYHNLARCRCSAGVVARPFL